MGITHNQTKRFTINLIRLVRNEGSHWGWSIIINKGSPIDASPAEIWLWRELEAARSLIRQGNYDKKHESTGS